MIRAFIALTPSETLLQRFAEVQTALQRLSLPFRWVQPSHIHLTLKFLGDIAPEMMDPIVRVLHHTVIPFPPFTISIRGLGCFPNQTRPRVLWMGVHSSHDMLLHLQQRLEAELLALGFAAEERPFQPHLTLARGQQRVSQPQLTKALQAYDNWHFGEMRVEQVMLYQSQLHRHGAVYSMLRSIPLPQ
jgi:2'-5' RNA ligase